MRRGVRRIGRLVNRKTGKVAVEMFGPICTGRRGVRQFFSKKAANLAIRHAAQHSKFQQKILRQRHNRCEVCNASGKTHILYVRPIDATERLSRQNSIVVCRACDKARFQFRLAIQGVSPVGSTPQRPSPTGLRSGEIPRRGVASSAGQNPVVVVSRTLDPPAGSRSDAAPGSPDGEQPHRAPAEKT